MRKRAESPYPSRDRPVLAAAGVLLLASTVLAAWSDWHRDWRKYQAGFRALVRETYGAERAASVPTGPQQIWVKELGVADRCMTCHQGILWKGLEAADQPYRTHPPGPLKSHPVERYGCTPCHGGQGFAVDVETAHGLSAHGREPLLGTSLGEQYGIVGDKQALLQMNCNACHRYERETTGADFINHAKRLVDRKGCRACHVVNGRGGTIGPDLTWEGDKAPNQFDMSRLSGRQTTFAWQVAHLKDPKALVAGTVMPNFQFGSKDAQALAMLVMSWRHAPVPAGFLPGVARTDPRSPGEIAEEERMKAGPGAWFVTTGCFVCHNVSSLGVKSPSSIGPDLSTAVLDTQSRFGKTVEDFLDSPTGTMQAVLSRQIFLTPEERALAVQKLRDAFAAHERQKAAAGKGTRTQTGRTGRAGPVAP